MYNNVENAGVKQVADAIKTLQNLSIGERNALMAALRVEDVKRAARAARPEDVEELGPWYILNNINGKCKAGYKKIRPVRDSRDDNNRRLQSECLLNGEWEWPPVTKRAARAKSTPVDEEEQQDSPLMGRAQL
jgi:hypothetical protein